MPNININTDTLKRGYYPEDEQNFSPEALKKLQTASRHICYLINEGYDLKMAYTFVGNHFALSERQRFAIARSIATTEQLNVRKAKEKQHFAALTALSPKPRWLLRFSLTHWLK